MRIVVDMQGAQSVDRFRGVSRYVTSFTQALARNDGGHDIILALNGLFPDTIEPLRAAFDRVLPQENIRVWYAPDPAGRLNAPKWRRDVAEHIRECFIAHLNPDVVLVGSLFEGLADNAVTSIGRMPRKIPTAVILYDLIPYIHRAAYLEDPIQEEWYLNKIDDLRRADLLLSIFESSRRDAIRLLGVAETSVIDISAAADADLRPRAVTPSREHELRESCGLHSPFVLCWGGTRDRGNLNRVTRAYAGLSKIIRERHQVAIVCEKRSPDCQHLIDVAGQEGLEGHELVIVEYGSEEKFADLCSLCSLFVALPSHEDCGLPALDAMSCGIPVIGADAFGLPELVGRNDALFRQDSGEDITRKMSQALTDGAFRQALARHGLEQARRFSWDASAERALSGLQQWHSARQGSASVAAARARPKLAYVSPLPPERSGISDYSGELLPELSRYYEIDVVVAQPEVSDSYIKATLPIRSVDWFRKHASDYDRVLYHFGNSTFHRHMFGLLREIPGVVVLHDFFLGNVIAQMDGPEVHPSRWELELFNSHGYEAIRQRFHATDTDEVIWRYPCNLNVLQRAQGIIVHSANSLRLARQWYGNDCSDWAMIPLLRVARGDRDGGAAREAMGLDAADFLVCAFGMLGPSKLNHRLLQAWLNSDLAHNKTCRLIFVGENVSNNYGKELVKTIRRNQAEEHVRITGWVDMDLFRQYLATADIAVQLRTLSRGETSAAVFDCMNYGAATIVNANGSMADLDEEAAWKLPDEFTDAQLTEALETLWQDAELRKRLGDRGQEIVVARHNPRRCAAQYRDAIERFSAAAASGIPALASAIAGLDRRPDDGDLSRIAQDVARSIAPPFKTRQLLLDISETCRNELQTGIERVARAVTLAFLERPPEGFRVEPVYLSDEGGAWHYRYARRFTLALLGCPSGILDDDVADLQAGDVLLGLDNSGLRLINAEAAGLFADYRNRGVAVYFTVFDLLPLRLPQHFPPGADEQHEKWLHALLGMDGVLCISRTVADDLGDWVQTHSRRRHRPFRIDWVQLGADIASATAVHGPAKEALLILASVAQRPTFLMVGTIEPRKGLLQVLDAFDRLWSEGVDVNLAIVGAEGWRHVPQSMRRTIPQIVARLESHSELGRRLFWIRAAPDDHLEKLYAASSCLIAASEGEGFGLPLIEAASHALPIMARDIPVFREAAGEHASYFAGNEPDALARVIKQWLALREKGKHPKSDAMAWITWAQSVERIKQILLTEIRPVGALPENTGAYGEERPGANEPSRNVPIRPKQHSC
jgi:glycosyltransferase involved in cell wall biosynthesis